MTQPVDPGVAGGGPQPGDEPASVSAPAAVPTVAPYGSWRSPVDVDLVAGVAVGLSEPWVDGDDVYWLESRAAEGGRRTLLRHGLDGVTRELTPAPFKAGNRVHEYGGGSFVVDRGRVIVSSAADGRLWQVDPEGTTPARAITPEGQWRFADMRLDPARDRLYAVRETHDTTAPDNPALVVNELVALALDGSDGPGRVLVAGPDFVAAPRPSPDGRHLAWLEWDLPNMPWDSVRLRVADVVADGSLGEVRTVAGGPDISVAQPAWSPSGVLHVVSDETAWWNLYAFDGPDGVSGPKRNLAPMEAELADPAWVFGGSSYVFLDDGAILAAARSAGRDHLLRIEASGAVTRLDTPFTEVDSLRIAGRSVVAWLGGPRDGGIIARLDPATGAVRGVLARSISVSLDAGVLSQPEPISYPTSGGATAHALYFPPANAAYRAPDGELPPLIVHIHGGPTAAASAGLSLDRTFYTSRGFGVVSVDYRGSTGYGRPYRDALRGQWGVVDVEDAVAAVRYLAGRGSVDRRRVVIRGGSAGGYTALAALCFAPDVFAAGISQYGIADLELIHQDSHKFESRYETSLVAPWTDEGRRIYRERSPIHHLHRITAPMLLYQGLDDKVVPPSQLDAMVAGFTERGLPHVAIRFEGEGHGFRKAESRRAVYRTDMAFLGHVLGFTPGDPDMEPLEVPGLA